jgi:integrase
MGNSVGKHAPGRLLPLNVGRLAKATVDKKTYHSDGGGLYVQLSPGGGASWVFRYKVGGRTREMGLGPLYTIGLAKAREKARQCRELRLDGIDPLEQRRAAKIKTKIEAARSRTFRECAESFIDSHTAAWRNPVHAAQWPASLDAYAYPIIGDLPVQVIDTALIMEVLQPIWTEKPETAGRVRSRIEAILSWATVSGYRQGENPARWRNHIDQLLPRKSKIRRVEHYRALPFDDLPELMAKLEQQQGNPARALRYLILTAARTSEVLGATWAEVDVAEKIWIIPGPRTKTGAEYRIPLSAAALAVIGQQRDLRKDEDEQLVFPGMRHGRALSAPSMLVVLRRIGYSATTHGMRACFRSWAAERTDTPHEILELALGHTIGDATIRAYARSDLVERRRHLMQRWADFCTEPAPIGGQVVVPIRA